MTDEEKAHKYTDEHGFGSDCNNLTSYDANREIEQAYLAGLKAGRPKWHILVEEPSTLPKEGQKVRVLTEEGKIEESTLFYDTYYEELAWSNIGLLKVFAWCEIPKFEEK